MPKKCNDPICPAYENKNLLSHKKCKKRIEEPKVCFHEISVINTNLLGTLNGKSTNCTRSRKKSKDRVKKSKICNYSKNCKNKKCQVSKQTVECSTSTCPEEKTRAKSKESMKRSSTSRLIHHDSRMAKRKICHCHNHDKEKLCDCKPRRSSCRQDVKSPRRCLSEETRRKKKPRKSCCRCKKYKRRESDQKNELLATLCICVKSPSSQDLVPCECRPSSAIIPSYGGCYCIENNRKKESGKRNDRVNCGTAGNSYANERISDFKCLCTTTSTLSKNPQEIECSQNILVKGLICMRKGIERMHASAISFFTSENSEPVHTYIRTPCPAYTNHPGTSLQKQNRHSSKRRKKSSCKNR